MRIHFILILLVSIFLFSCKKSLDESSITAHFYAYIEPFNDYPAKVKLKNASTGATTYRWDFGNGKTSTSENPEMEYSSSGRFNVKLVVMDGKKADSVTWPVTIHYRLRSLAVVYVIPRGLKFDTALYNGIKRAVPEVQQWYREQLGGKTFRLNTPLVDTVLSQHTYEWFQSGTGYGDVYPPQTFTFYTTINEVQRLRGQAINTTGQMLLIFLPVKSFSDRDGNGGVTNNKGVIACAAVYEGICRRISFSDRNSWALWVTGHELGHAFGLPHNNNYQGLMFSTDLDPPYVGDSTLGYGKFPECFLLDSEKDILENNWFID